MKEKGKDTRTGLEVAVIGMACRFPGARKIDEFWRNLKDGVETISFFSEKELFDAGEDADVIGDANYVRAVGMLEEIACFDAPFFGYTPREAELMNPQTRIFHECSWSALEDAGYNPQDCDCLIGCYAGATPTLSWEMRSFLSGKSAEIGNLAAGHLARKDYLSLRLSYKFDLNGPSFVLYTACSTSLVAIHLACQGILNGECDIALAGGVTVSHLEKAGYLYREGMIGSPDGHCRTFDARAKGIVPGDGAGVVVLRRLGEAIRDGDHIYALIKGSAINNDGVRKAGFTAPSVEGQAEVIKMAHQVAEIESVSIGYLETHGTGTELGDPVEIEALKLAFNTARRGFCALGSVKSNVGHVDSAAGVAGFIKTVLALTHRIIPPTLHFESPNPRFDLIASPFFVNSRASAWEGECELLRAGVSSFGIGGTNAHVVLEEWPMSLASSDDTGRSETSQPRLIVLSALTQPALESKRRDLANYLEDRLEEPGFNFADVLYTLQVGRKAFKHRWMVLCREPAEAVDVLRSPGGGEEHVLTLEEENAPPGEEIWEGSQAQLGRLWLQGKTIDWHSCYAGQKRRRVPLPTYPFERHRYWIDGYSLRKDRDMIKARFRGNGDKPADIADRFYLPVWKQSVPRSLEYPGNDSPPKAPFLVFVNRLNFARRLVTALEETGQEVVVVEISNGFSNPGKGRYALVPGESSHYDTLFGDLEAQGIFPGKIIHLWNVEGENRDKDLLEVDDFQEAQELGFYSLLYLAKSLGRKHFSRDIRLYVLSDPVHEVVGREPLSPGKATSMGLVKVISQELPGLFCSHIDIQLAGSGEAEQKELIDRLLEEFLCATADPAVAYRGPFRWLEDFHPLHLPKVEGQPPGLRKQGVYLVTGGLGKIGLMFSELLVKHVGARLVLTGRSPFPSGQDARLKKIRELEEMGGEVLYLQADVAHLEQMKAVLRSAEEKFGPINGVIHSAGIIEGDSMRSIRDLTEEDCRLQFQAKVQGLMVLQELFKDRGLDFGWLLSSISCVLGGLGFGAYASANCFMDTFAKRHNRRSGFRWLSVNWDGANADESIDAFERLFALENIDQVVFAREGRLRERIDRWVKLRTLKDEGAHRTGESIPGLQPRPALSTPYVPPRSAEEKAFARIWQNLLGYDRVGIQDDFLELGGDSLKAITVISRVHDELQVNIPVVEFFRKPTIQALAEFTCSREEKGLLSSPGVRIEPAARKEYYPATSAQKRLYILQQVQEDNISYNISILLSVEGKIDRKRMESTFKKLIRRHETLRTSFELVKDEPVQLIRSPETVHFEIERETSVQGASSPVPEQAAAAFIKPFDLSTAPLMRVGLVRQGEDKHFLMLDMHHVIFDGISLRVLLKDFLLIYNGEELAPLEVQYKDYSEWQNSESHKRLLREQREFWLEQFADPIPRLSLPADYERSLTPTFAGDGIGFDLGKDTTRGLKELAIKEETTLFVVLLTLYNVFLAMLSGEEDIVIGTGVGGRQYPVLQPLIGMFVNTLALRNRPERQKDFRAFLGEVRATTLQAFENQDYPLESLVEQVALQRSMNRNPLFDTVIVSQDLDVDNEGSRLAETAGLTITSCPFKNKVSNFDLGLLFNEVQDRIHITFEYSTALFKKKTMRFFVTYFKSIAAQVLEDSDIKLGDLTLPHRFLRADAANPEMELGF